jgi:hypothetical protein
MSSADLSFIALPADRDATGVAADYRDFWLARWTGTRAIRTLGELPVDAASLAPILFGAAASVRDPNEGYILTEPSIS